MSIVLTGKPSAGRLHAKAAGHATHLQVTHLIWLILTGFIACFTVALVEFAPEYVGICSTGNRPVEAQTRTPEPLPTQSASADFPVQNHPAFQQQALAPAPAVRLNKVAICTSIKWEQPVDLEEWVQYYRCARSLLCATAEATRSCSDAHCSMIHCFQPLRCRCEGCGWRSRCASLAYVLLRQSMAAFADLCKQSIPVSTCNMPVA